ncbi:MAG: hypothetical protein WCV41_04075 [Patescibacteria group bacterium]
MQNIPYDKNKIGKFLGWGGEHLVFDYGDGQVIKFSLHVCLAGKKAVRKLKRDYEMGQKYFAPYLLPTEILTWKNEARAAEIQEKISCRFLKFADLKDDLIKKQFTDIMERYERMEKEIGAPFDLLGREGLFKLNPDFFSNILIMPDNKLALIDFTLLELKPSLFDWPIWFIIKWAKRKQEKILRKFLLVAHNA